MSTSSATTPRSKGDFHFGRAVLQTLSSLRLTVALLSLSILVVFFGTLAQTEDGLYVAQEKYFKSVLAVWSPHDPSWKWIKIPLPGGYLLGVLLLLNLFAAHATRFKFTWKKSGIFLTHVGIILLLVGQLTTDMFARESRMRFAEGEYRNYTEDFHACELAVLTDTTDASMDKVVVFPESRLKAGAELKSTHLPFTIRIQEFQPNSDPDIRRKPETGNEFNGIGRRFEFREIPITRSMDSKNVPTMRIEVVDSSGKAVGRWILSNWAGDADMSNVLFVSWLQSFQKEKDPAPFKRARQLVDQMTVPQTLEMGNRTFTLTLRPKRYYQDFALTLREVTHEKYQGTELAKNFKSRVQIDNSSTGEKREVDIYMNNPLRYGGLTFFQHQMDSSTMNLDGRPVTTFQVVKNPTWLTPYLGTLVVGLGLLVQFSIHLFGFVRKRTS